MISLAYTNHWYIFFYFFFVTLLLSSFWTSRGHRCRPFSAGFCLQFFIVQTQCPAIPLLVDLSHESVANSRSLAFHKSKCAQEKSPRNFTRMHAGELEHTKLTHARLEDSLIFIRHRGDRLYIHWTGIIHRTYGFDKIKGDAHLCKLRFLYGEHEYCLSVCSSH